MATLAETAIVFGVALFIPYLSYYWYIRRYARANPIRGPISKLDARVSVIVCALNAADVIERKIRSIIDQDYPLHLLDVMVVDGGSTDRTVEILSKMKNETSETINLIIIEGRKFVGKAAQLNEGIRTSQTDFLITTDADTQIGKTAFSDILRSLLVDGVGAVCANQVILNPQQSMVTQTESVYKGYINVLRIGESNLHSTPVFEGGLSGYRRAAISPIDEDVNADDTQLAFRSIRSGYRSIHDLGCRFYVEAASSWRDGWRQRVRRGQGLQRVFWRNRDMLFSRRYGNFAFPIFTAEFFMHFIGPFIFVLLAISLGMFVLRTILQFLPLSIALLLVVMAGWIERRSIAVALPATFTVYQLALIWALVLHLFGRNFQRWGD